MASDPDCIFCKIVAGELPTRKVDEDDRTISFLDINPGTHGHTLVIPKEHARDLLEIAPEDLAAVVQAAQRLAKRMPEALGADGVNLINSCGSVAWQTVLPLPSARDPALLLRHGATALDTGRRRRTARPGCGGAARMTSRPPSGAVGQTLSRSFGPWTLEQDGPLAVLTISKPPLNLFDREVDEGLHDAIRHVATERPRGLLLRADGRVWTGGVDVNLFKDLDPQAGGDLWRRGFELVQGIEDLPFPVVFAAHALCLTWGLEIALACDLLVAAEGAQFGLVEVRVGLTPSMGGPQRLAERAGPARAREFVMTGDLYPASTLHDWGVVNKVWPDAEFEERSRELARRLAEGPTIAHAATKRIIQAQKEEGVRAADAVVPALSGALFATEDLKNAVESFLADGPGKATYVGR